MTNMLKELEAQSKFLRKAAAEIAAAGHAGWGNTCLQAAEALDTHHAEIADMAKRVEAVERDAARFHALERFYTAANFQPQEMDLGEGVALIFMLPAGSSVSGHLGKTIDAATQEGEG